MAVSANQMQIVGHGESAVSALSLRNKALLSLRNQIGLYESSAESALTPDQLASREETADQIMCSAVLMCFFDVSLDCLQSWKVHSDFACSFVLAQVTKRQRAGRQLSGPLLFASGYFASHHVLAFTVDSPNHPGEMFQSLQYLTDSTLMQTLTGCPRWLMDLISEITDLSMHPLIASLRSTPMPPSSSASPQSTATNTHQKNGLLPPDLQQRRDDIERRLHGLVSYADDGVEYNDDMDIRGDCIDPIHNNNDTSMVTSPSLPWDDDDDDMRHIVETKRLAALMYLYARVDRSGPYKPHMMRLTSRIVALLPSISTRTNTILWPLFIVATLGVRPESEDERRIVLGKLEELLQTRQLGNVRKAREIIVDVWKARDLRAADATKSWSILNGRLDTISLA